MTAKKESRDFGISAAEDGGFYVVDRGGFREGMYAAIRFAGSLVECLDFVRQRLTEATSPKAPS